MYIRTSDFVLKFFAIFVKKALRKRPYQLPLFLRKWGHVKDIPDGAGVCVFCLRRCCI